jgi:hypothetical protein
MTVKLINYKVERMLWHAFKYCADIYLEKLKKETTNNHSHESRSEYHSTVTSFIMFNRGIMKCKNCFMKGNGTTNRK